MFHKSRDAHTITLKNIRIPDGISDISTALGLNPVNTVWDFNWVNAVSSGIHTPDLLAGKEHQGILPMARGSATAITLKLHEGQLDHMQAYAGVGKVIEVTDRLPEGGSGHYWYPDHTVAIQAVRAAQRNGELAKLFNEKVFCPNFSTPEIEQSVQSIGARPLLPSIIAARFNSKVASFIGAKDADYRVAPFEVFSSEEQLEEALHNIKAHADKLGISEEVQKFWVKFDCMAGGDGVFAYDPKESSIEDIKTWIRRIRAESDLPVGTVHPLVVDIDIGCLPDVKQIVGNFCVQSVVSDDAVSYTGITAQRTKNGKYLGGMIPFTDEEQVYTAEAQKSAANILLAQQKAGYRGYMGVDVIMTEHKDGSLQGYVLEANARVNSSTSLLSTHQWAEREAGTRMRAFNIDMDLSPIDNGFIGYTEKFNDCLYLGAKTDYTGVIPTFFHFDGAGRINRARVIALATNDADINKLEQRYTHG